MRNLPTKQYRRRHEHRVDWSVEDRADVWPRDWMVPIRDLAFTPSPGRKPDKVRMTLQIYVGFIFSGS